MENSVSLVTGANSGIGQQIAVQLARSGVTLVLLCRDEAAAERTRRFVTPQSSGAAVETLVADLSSQREIRRAASELQNRYPRLDLLVNNAGANFSRRTLTEDGIESTFAVNAVAPFLLTELVADNLKRSATGRVINVASGMLAPIEWDDILMRDRQYRQMAAYAQSKMAVVLWTRWLSRSLAANDVAVVSMTPGMVRDTGLGRDTKGALKLFLKAMYPLMRTPAAGAADVVDLALRPAEALHPGGFYKRRELDERRGLQEEQAVARVVELLHGAVRPAADVP